jgi:hypothetical protein
MRTQLNSSTRNDSKFGRFYVGMYDTFKGCDHRGVLEISGEIRRLWQDAEGNVWAAIRCKQVRDKHMGRLFYEGMDVTRSLQLTGGKVDMLHGRLNAAAV